MHNGDRPPLPTSFDCTSALTGDQFTIQWDRVHNHDHVENGTFTFQLSLFKDGRIHFVYREVHVHVHTSLISNLQDKTCQPRIQAFHV